MKISIITVCFNAASTIEDAILSVDSQSYPNIEHIIVDGDSIDGTQGIIDQHRSKLAHVISEPDKGIYDAMNKGIKLASGDVIGILNADDFYANEKVLARVMSLHQDQSLDACYADLVFVNPNDLNQVVRRWKSKAHQPGLCFKGWMPAHPTLFLKRRVYEKSGLFDQSLRLQADLVFCAKVFEIDQISSLYVPEQWVKMRSGGASHNSLGNFIRGNWESYIALRKMGLKTNPVSYFFVKFLPKLSQLIR